MDEIISILIIALHIIEHSQKRMSFQMILIFQLFLHLLTPDLIPAPRTQIHVISIKVWICPAS